MLPLRLHLVFLMRSCCPHLDLTDQLLWQISRKLSTWQVCRHQKCSCCTASFFFFSVKGVICDAILSETNRKKRLMLLAAISFAVTLSATTVNCSPWMRERSSEWGPWQCSAILAPCSAAQSDGVAVTGQSGMMAVVQSQTAPCPQPLIYQVSQLWGVPLLRGGGYKSQLADCGTPFTLNRDKDVAITMATDGRPGRCGSHRLPYARIAAAFRGKMHLKSVTVLLYQQNCIATTVVYLME